MSSADIEKINSLFTYYKGKFTYYEEETSEQKNNANYKIIDGELNSREIKKYKDFFDYLHNKKYIYQQDLEEVIKDFDCSIFKFTGKNDYFSFHFIKNENLKLATYRSYEEIRIRFFMDDLKNKIKKMYLENIDKFSFDNIDKIPIRIYSTMYFHSYREEARSFEEGETYSDGEEMYDKETDYSKAYFIKEILFDKKILKSTKIFSKLFFKEIKEEKNNNRTLDLFEFLFYYELNPKFSLIDTKKCIFLYSFIVA